MKSSPRRPFSAAVATVLALAVLAAAAAPEFESVFVDGDDALEARYGARVPVLREDRLDAELDWPFDARRLGAFLAGGR